uniref:Transposase IS30-like HTH domain-containing protein n=1 Tax=Strigamia maritima TaxID=126957 RepID=T1IWZ2_STRMM
MGRLTNLSKYEKGQIDILKDQGKSIKVIAEYINRPKSTVGEYLAKRSGKNLKTKDRTQTKDNIS